MKYNIIYLHVDMMSIILEMKIDHEVKAQNL